MCWVKRVGQIFCEANAKRELPAKDNPLYSVSLDNFTCRRQPFPLPEGQSSDFDNRWW